MSPRILTVVGLTLYAAMAAAQVRLAPSHANAPAGTAVTTPDTDHRIIMRVNGVPFEERELRANMRKLFPFYAIHGNRIPDGATAEIRTKALNQIAFEELLYETAKRRNYTVAEERVRAVQAEVIRQFPSRKDYRSWTTAKYGSEAEHIFAIRRELLMTKLWKIEVEQKSAVTDAIARDYYARNKALFVRPDSIAVQTITISLIPNATPDEVTKTKALAQEVFKLAKAAKTYKEFGALAEKYSDDDWRVMMGDHRWVHRGALSKDLEAVAFQLQKGETSNLIENRDQFIILRVNDKEARHQMSYAEVNGTLLKDLRKRRKQQRIDDLDKQLRAAAKIEVLKAADSVNPQ